MGGALTASVVANAYLLENVKNYRIREEALWDTMDRIHSISALYILKKYPDKVWITNSFPTKEKEKMKKKNKMFLPKDERSNTVNFFINAAKILFVGGAGCIATAIGINYIDSKSDTIEEAFEAGIDAASNAMEEVADCTSEMVEDMTDEI